MFLTAVKALGGGRNWNLRDDISYAHRKQEGGRERGGQERRKGRGPSGRRGRKGREGREQEVG